MMSLNPSPNLNLANNDSLHFGSSKCKTPQPFGGDWMNDLRTAFLFIVTKLANDIDKGLRAVFAATQVGEFF